MKKIHYFQRYSSKENWITNATMLFLSRLNYSSPLLLQNVLYEILTENKVHINVGAQFGQQAKGRTSIPDGVILQESFQIAIETKLENDFTTSQLENHIGLLDEYNADQSVLLGLSRLPVTNEIKTKVTAFLKAGGHKRIQFASITFSRLIEIIQSIIPEREFSLLEILEDYHALCIESNLTDIQEHTMLAVTASTSIVINRKYNLYYDPATRNHNLPFTYMGLYQNKEIIAIGKLQKTVYCNLVEGQLVSPDGSELDLSLDEYDRIKNTIEETGYYDLRMGNKFYLVDEFINTSLKKRSKSPLRAKQYFFFTRNDEFSDYQKNFNKGEIAEWLKSQNWQ